MYIFHSANYQKVMTSEGLFCRTFKRIGDDKPAQMWRCSRLHSDLVRDLNIELNAVHGLAYLLTHLTVK